MRLLDDAGADMASDMRVMNGVLNDAPLTFTTGYCLRRRGTGTFLQVHEKSCTEMKVTRRLLSLQVEMIHVVSWLWQRDAPSVPRVADDSAEKQTIKGNVYVHCVCTGGCVVDHETDRAEGRDVPLVALLMRSMPPLDAGEIRSDAYSRYYLCSDNDVPRFRAEHAGSVEALLASSFFPAVSLAVPSIWFLLLLQRVLSAYNINYAICRFIWYLLLDASGYHALVPQ